MNTEDRFDAAFRELPDTVIITDIYWYVLAFNLEDPFRRLRRGQNLRHLIPDCGGALEGKYTSENRVFRWSATPVYENGAHVGYVVYLADVTQAEQLLEQSRIHSKALAELTREQQKANAELEAYVLETERVLDYAEQVRIARSIHDEAGHTITALNMISQMCLQLREQDPQQFRERIREGIELCQDALRGREEKDFSSLREMLEDFCSGKPFPIELRISGESEPPFAAPLYGLICDICEEAYSNTVSHSLADRMEIGVWMDQEKLMLHLTDNGRFSGVLEKGFGLQSMEERVTASGGQIKFMACEGQGFGILAEWRKEHE